MSHDATSHSITLQPLDRGFPSGGATILEAAEAAGFELPNSCRNGTCRTCICRLEGGAVRYLVEWPGLSIEEKRENWLLPCVAVPTADVVVNAPLAKRLAW
ncbi:2Fe-2S iron-sulfur cluster-binding protein [Massilia sp.]|uniref:2Fe-2S iron-sulfur cluster-binding protein n=1 Tax=Massilia sp. TaxID=1882437 RepID=UPI0028AD22D8|nr:2Fe-2S iron-sulfur cluster-binding protein [Massilia sp.]